MRMACMRKRVGRGLSGIERLNLARLIEDVKNAGIGGFLAILIKPKMKNSWKMETQCSGYVGRARLPGDFPTFNLSYRSKVPLGELRAATPVRRNISKRLSTNLQWRSDVLHGRLGAHRLDQHYGVTEALIKELAYPTFIHNWTSAQRSKHPRMAA